MCAAVSICESERPPPIASDVLADLFGLTPAEARVAAAPAEPEMEVAAGGDDD